MNLKAKIKTWLEDHNENISLVKRKVYRAYQLFGWYVIRSEKWKWDEKLYGLLKDVPEDKIKLYTTVLNMQHDYINASIESLGKNSAIEKEIDFEKIAKLVLDNLTILDIVGCQPMTGAVMLLKFLTITEKKKEEDGSSRLSLEILSTAIEAQTRQLHAKWAIEEQQDAKALHGLDIASELQQAIAGAVAHEITAEQIMNLKAISTKVKLKMKSNAPMKSNDVMKTVIAMQQAANDIAIETRRGTGNHAVLSSVTFARMVSFLRDQPDIFDESDLGKSPSIGALVYVGTLNGTIKLYVDTFCDQDSILVGYKGRVSELDAGYFFNPFVMLLTAGIVANGETFQPEMRLMTRYNTYPTDNVKGYYRELVFNDV